LDCCYNVHIITFQTVMITRLTLATFADPLLLVVGLLLITDS